MNDPGGFQLATLSVSVLLETDGELDEVFIEIFGYWI